MKNNINWTVPKYDLKLLLSDIKIYFMILKKVDGEIINFKDYKNKVVLLVNTASYCGFTKQYDFTNIMDKYRSKGLIVLGFHQIHLTKKKKKMMKKKILEKF